MKIKEIATQIRGVSYKPENASETSLDGYVPLLRAHNIQDDGLNLERLVYVDRNKVKPVHYIKKGDIVVCASSGSLHLVGKAAQATHDYDAVFGAFCKIIRPADSVSAEYVGHFFHSDYYRGKIVSVSEGANINNIRAEHIDEITIPLPPLDKQRRIAAVLDKVTALIADRKRQLEQLDLMVKSQFVELFGDIYGDEKGFRRVALKECCEINPRKSDDKSLTDDLEVSFVPMTAVSEQGQFDLSETRKYADVKNGFTYFAEDDVLLAKITPCFENGKGGVAQNLMNGVGFGSTEFHVLRPLDGVSASRWLYHLTTFERFREEAANNMTGTAGQRRIPAPYLEKFTVPLPPLALQNRFAAFAEAADKSKFEIRQGLEKLELQLGALMQQYFG